LSAGTFHEADADAPESATVPATSAIDAHDQTDDGKVPVRACAEAPAARKPCS